MPEFIVGRFKVSVADPYPCWVHISEVDRPAREIRMHHNELSDLAYALKRASREARDKLGKDRGEADL
jgi:hypothetical protein